MFFLGLLVLQGVSAGSILNGSEIGANSKTYLQNFNDLVGSAFQDSFNNLISGSTFSGVSAQMPWSTLLFSHFGMYALFVVLVIAAGVFVKARSALGYGQ